MDKGLIIRTIMLVLALTNRFLISIGKPIFDVDEGSVTAFVTMAMEATVYLTNWWYNNNVTTKAKAGQATLDKLKGNK